MLFLCVLLAVTLCSELHAAPFPLGPALDKWDLHCSPGLECKARRLNFYSPPCRSPPQNGSSVIRNVTVSTMLRCQGAQKCFLQLIVSTTLPLSELVHGLSICILTPGPTQRCQRIVFSKSSRQRMEGFQVEVEAESISISPGQGARVKVHTVPELCGVGWTETFQAPECSSGDLRRKVPQCITGSLQYELSPEGRSLTVAVSDMLNGEDYRLRLCLEGFVCSETGANVLIKKEDVVKKVSLPFTRPLPCLCIEGWSAVMDAPRVRVCPFRDQLDELWSGITYEPQEGELSWQPACPVDVVVSLYHMGYKGELDVRPHAAQSTRSSKVTFTKVDPNPQLCVKFSMGLESWTRCPFKEQKRWP